MIESRSYSVGHETHGQFWKGYAATDARVEPDQKTLDDPAADQLHVSDLLHGSQ